MRILRLINLRLNLYNIAFVDDEDYPEVKKHTWSVDHRPYTKYAVNGKLGRLHTFIMKPPKELDVSHKDGNGLNCTKSNMEVTTRRINIRTTLDVGPLTGVARAKNGRYTARLRFPDGTRPSLGVFDTPEEAALAYQNAVKRIYG